MVRKTFRDEYLEDLVESSELVITTGNARVTLFDWLAVSPTLHKTTRDDGTTYTSGAFQFTKYRRCTFFDLANTLLSRNGFVRWRHGLNHHAALLK